MFSSLFFLVGALLASFFSCRLYRAQHFLWAFEPRSFCENCHQTLTFWQLIPIIGFLLQKGRCHFCQSPIAPISTLNELFFGMILSLLPFFVPQTLWLQTFLICSWLFYLSLFDLATRSVPLIPLLFGGSLNVIFFAKTHFFFEWSIFGLGLLLLVLGNLSGKLGHGDTLVISFLAFELPFQELLLLLIYASSVALFYTFFFKVSHELAFIPALFLGYLLTLFI